MTLSITISRFSCRRIVGIGSILLLLFFQVCCVCANEVHAKKGVVSTRSELASQAGVDAMQQGGNAIDAIVASAFALAVTYPSAGNLGGGGFIVFRQHDGSTWALDFREIAPAASTRDMFLDEDGNYDPNVALRSRMASGVPGSVAGLLLAHERFGKLSRQEVLAEAIRLAEEGFELPEDVARQIAGRRDVWLRSDGSRNKFLDEDGEVLEAGSLFVQKDLAATLQRISEEGRDGFYQGKTAELIVAEMARGNGLISLEDLKDYTPKWRDPIVGTYREHEVVSMPPPSSGGIILIQMLNMLEPHDLTASGFGTASTLHLMAEVERRAYSDRAEYLGDTDFFPVPIETLTSKKYSLSRFEDFDANSATLSKSVSAGQIPSESEETTHLSAIDSEGNAVALTTTLNSGYGNGYVVQGAGFLLNNEMDDFSAKPGVPNQFGLVGGEANAIEPKKRMLSSMTPTILVHTDGRILVTGSPGGSTIITTVLQIIVNLVDHEMSLHEAVGSPRFHHQWLPDQITVERDKFEQETLDELTELGHKIATRAAIGDANSALATESNVIGVSDPRNKGAAVGLD